MPPLLGLFQFNLTLNPLIPQRLEFVVALCLQCLPFLDLAFEVGVGETEFVVRPLEISETHFFGVELELGTFELVERGARLGVCRLVFLFPFC